MSMVICESVFKSLINSRNNDQKTSSFCPINLMFRSWTNVIVKRSCHILGLCTGYLPTSPADLSVVIILLTSTIKWKGLKLVKIVVVLININISGICCLFKASRCTPAKHSPALLLKPVGAYWNCAFLLLFKDSRPAQSMQRCPR